jgi:GTP cyclohydrolase II
VQRVPLRRGYRHSVDGAVPSEPVAVVYGDVEGKEKVAVRVHDACFTSEVLGSLKCDCKQQAGLGHSTPGCHSIGYILVSKPQP